MSYIMSVFGFIMVLSVAVLYMNSISTETNPYKDVEEHETFDYTIISGHRESQTKKPGVDRKDS